MREHSRYYKPVPRFFGGGTAYLGLELEVEAPDAEKKRDGLALENPRWGYAKRDGSLHWRTGWEMVTHPISVALWLSRENVRDYHDIAPYTVLTGKYKGVTYQATALGGGQVEWNGTTYNSISAAGKAIRGGKSTNGYQFFGLKNVEAGIVVSFFNLVAQLKEMGYTSHENGRCGFHVHVSRRAFAADGGLDNPTFFRFKALINGALFRKICQRMLFNFCQQEPVTRENFLHQRGRYCAVNVTATTVEVRIFRGNLREDRLRKNIEAVIAALEFAKCEEYGGGNYTTPTDEQFAAYTREHADRFPNLAAYIA